MMGQVLKVGIYHATLPRGAGKKGGVEASVHRLANSLAEMPELDVTVISSGSTPPDAKYQHLRMLDWSNRWRLSRLFLSPILLNFKPLAEFDVLHFHGDDWFCLRPRSAVVRTFHGSALYESKHADRFSRKALMRVIYLLELMSASKADARVAVNGETAKLYDCDVTIGNGVDLDTFLPTLKSTTPSVSFVGTWHGRKRGEFLYREFVTKVLPIVPSARLKMVTDFCDPHPAVDHIQHASDADVASIIGSSWAFAYPSTYEGFGIPYIEALAAGTAIVSSPNGGASEILDAGSYGRIVADDDFGNAIVEVLQNHTYRESMQAKGLIRSQHYSAERVAKRYCSVYQSAVLRHGKLYD